MDRSTLSLLILTTDGFSRYQKKWGSDAQDILKFVASTLRLSLENIPCSVYRYQNDGFAVIFPGAGPEVAERCARRVVNTMRQRPFLLGEHLFRISLSGGIATLPGDAANEVTLVARAREAKNVAHWGIYGRLMQYRQITRRLALSGTVLVVLAFLLSMGASRLLMTTSSPAVPEQQPPVTPPPVPQPPAPLPSTNVTPTASATPDRVILKSGGILEGTIIRQSDQRTEMRLDMNNGAGIINIRNSDIQSLERHH